MKIEMSVDLDQVRKTSNYVTHSIKMLAMMKTAGVPVTTLFPGSLMLHGIDHGTLTWRREVDLDGDNWLITWQDDNHDSQAPLVGVGQADGVSWRVHGGPVVEVEDEL